MAPILPQTATDWQLFDELVRVHLSVSELVDRDLYEWWGQWNRLYFAETLRPLFLHSGNTDYGKALGCCHFRPTREILVQKQGIKAPAKGMHHSRSVRQHEAFAGLSEQQYAVALIVLHEMVHQACFEAGVDAGHEGEPWADHCNAIGADLGLRLTFSPMHRGKEARLNVDGTPARDAAGKPIRDNVWRPTRDKLLPGTDRFATVSECRHFPFRQGDPFVIANTVTIETGKAVAANGGKPITMLPKF